MHASLAILIFTTSVFTTGCGIMWDKYNEIKEEQASTGATSLAYSADEYYYKSFAMTAINPVVNGDVISYSVSPALPVGMNLDAVTGEITGTPSVFAISANYTITATTSVGTVDTILTTGVGMRLDITGGDPLVDNGDSNPGDEICNDGLGNCTLRAATEEAQADSGQPKTLINIPAGTYTVTSPLTVWRNIELQGAGSVTTKLDGGGVNRILESIPPIGSYGFTISDMSIENGIANDGKGGAVRVEATILSTYRFNNCQFNNNQETGGFILNHGGGAIRIYNSKVIIDNCSFSNNSVTNNRGGALNIYYSTANISNSSFSNNTGYGAAISFKSNNYTTISDSQFTLNTSPSQGGAINSDDSLLYVYRSEFTSNTALGAGRGGAIYANDTGWLEVYDSTFSLNQAGEGGAIYFSALSADSIVENSTFYDNTATTNGGAFSLITGNKTVTFINVTASNNTAVTGGNLYMWAPSLTVNLKNSIIANSAAGGDCSVANGVITSLGYNIDSDNSCSFSGATNDIPNTDPLLTVGAPQDNGGPTKSILLQAGSPARNIIPSVDCLTTDQRGLSRPGSTPGDTFCDSGAVEAQNGE